jgi:uncharacterized membrane protein YcaP (DUF421 family)
MDLSSMFRLTVDPLELVIRGTAMYWFLFALFRIVLRRDVGAIGIADVLLLVLVADASQNAMAGGYESITDGCILVGTIAGWSYIFDWASFHFEPVRRLFEPAPLELVRDGRLLRANMRKELVSVDELNAKLREHGIENFALVKLATMESDGEITIIKRDDPAGEEVEGPRRTKAGAP